MIRNITTKIHNGLVGRQGPLLRTDNVLPKLPYFKGEDGQKCCHVDTRVRNELQHLRRHDKAKGHCR
jgi:hypothetical protein